MEFALNIGGSMKSNDFEKEVYNSQLEAIREEHEALKDKPGIEDYISCRIQVLNQLFEMKE